MTRAYHTFYGDGGMVPDSGAATLERVAGTARTGRGRGFDSTVEQIAEYKLRAVEYDDSGAVTIDVDWWADTASTNGVAFEVAGCAITPGDSDNLTTKSWGTVSTQVTANGGTIQLNRTTLTISRANFQTLTKDDDAWIRLTRKVDNGGDNLAAVAVVDLVTVHYEMAAA